MSYLYIRIIPIPAPLRDIDKPDSATNKGIAQETALALAAPALADALESVARYAAAEIGVPFEECVSGPIGQARAALAKARP